jgi:glutamate/tyrosine decarboxylase-like PLP-dependent enzyme
MKLEANSIKTLTPNREEMRALGYRVVDMLVDHYETIADKSATRGADRETLERLLREPAPRSPGDPEAILDKLARDVLSHTTFAHHPRFFAYVPGPAGFVGALADALASGYNLINATWLESASQAQLELVAVDWLREWCGLPDEAGGLFVSGGSVANLTGLAVARRIKLDDRVEGAVVYCSAQTHGSLAKNLRLLGLGEGHVVKLPVDGAFRLDPAALRAAIARDRAAGRRPFCVIANAGTTNTGAVDPLREIGEICRAHDLWLHVDGAYGAAAVLTARGKALLRGLDVAHSIAVDPHKWLFQPYEIGCALVRDRAWLPRTFGAEHEYMQDADLDLDRTEVNFSDYGIQLTRGFRALKFWFTVKVFGTAALADAIDYGIDLAEYAEQELRAAGCFEIVSPAQLAMVGFRYRTDPDGEEASDALNRAIVRDMLADGFAMISSTRLRGRSVLRLCTINPRTTRADVRETIGKIAAFGRQRQEVEPA